MNPEAEEFSEDEEPTPPKDARSPKYRKPKLVRVSFMARAEKKRLDRLNA